MSWGHSIIPITPELLQDQNFMDSFEAAGLFMPNNIAYGHFPKKEELREVIQRLGYVLEETSDWYGYVTSENDYTEIWFSDDNASNGNNTTGFWFNRGGPIVLNIMQALASSCGTCAVFPHSGAPAILIVPETNFTESKKSVQEHDFFAVIERRIPIMIAQLKGASLGHILFLLSQIHQALYCAADYSQYSFFQVAQQGFETYKELLHADDARVRILAFDVLAIFKERGYETIDPLRETVQRENDSAVKAQMLDTLKLLLEPNAVQNYGREQTQSIWELLTTLSEGFEETPSVRLAAANLLAYARPGFLTKAMNRVFVDALVNTDGYAQKEESGHFVVSKVLASVENLMLQSRIELLIKALPSIPYAQDAHDVLRELLDHVFFGSKRQTAMTRLTDANEAERLPVDPRRDPGLILQIQPNSAPRIYCPFSETFWKRSSH